MLDEPRGKMQSQAQLDWRFLIKHDDKKLFFNSLHEQFGHFKKKLLSIKIVDEWGQTLNSEIMFDN